MSGKLSEAELDKHMLWLGEPAYEKIRDHIAAVSDERDELLRACEELKAGGVGAIAAERLRQIECECWTPEHDDEHSDNSLAMAAAHYAYPLRPKFEADDIEFCRRNLWPILWDRGFDKKLIHSRRRQLVIAGALIAAEIDRLDRAAIARAQGEKGEG